MTLLASVGGMFGQKESITSGLCVLDYWHVQGDDQDSHASGRSQIDPTKTSMYILYLRLGSGDYDSHLHLP